MTEISERADYAYGLIVAQSSEQLFKGTVRFRFCISPESHRQLADLLDQVERSVPVLISYDVAQNASEQTDVLHQRAFVFAGTLRRFGSGICGHDYRDRWRFC